MNPRNQAMLGLQWGACAWLVYVVFQSVRAGLWPMAALWIASCALIAARSRWARAVVALGILAQVLIGLTEGARLAGLPGVSGSLAFWLSFSLPMCAPLVPLVLWRVEEPRIVVGLLALGRWREARARSGRLIVLSAAAVVLCNRALLDVLREGAFVSRTAQLFVAVAAASLALAMPRPSSPTRAT
jgi:hypothetical protein